MTRRRNAGPWRRISAGRGRLLGSSLTLIALAVAGETSADVPPPIPETIDLATVDAVELQRLLDRMAVQRCGEAGAPRCTWRVLSLGRAPSPSAAPTPATGRRFDGSVPVGFERLAARRPDVYDVWSEGRSVLRAEVELDSATLRFSDPVAVAEALAATGVADRLALETFLGGDHPLDPDAVCVDDVGPRDCLDRSPRPLALLPDAPQRRVELIVRESQRPLDRVRIRRLPAANRDLDARLATRAAVAAITERETASDVSVDGSLSYGAGGLFGAVSYGSTDRRTRVFELYGAHQFADHRLQIGTVELPSGGLLLSQRLLGLEWERSLNTLLDTPALFATPVLVELAERSVVQLVVDGVVRHSETLDAGLREVRSDRLPEGTYPLEIRVRSASAGLVSTTRTYSRSRQLPPPGRPVYGFTLGSPRDLDRPDNPLAVDGDALFSGHVATRLGARSSVRLQASGYKRSTVAELQLSRLGDRHRLQVDGLVGTESSVGAAVQGAYRGRRLGVSARGLTFRSDADLIGDPDLARFLRPDTDEVGASVDLFEGPWALGLRVDRSRVARGGVSDVIDRRTLSLRRRLSLGVGIDSHLSARYVDSDVERRIELRFSLDARRGNVLQGLSQGFERRAGGDWEPSLGYSATWRSDRLGARSVDRPARDLSTTVFATTRASRDRLGLSASVVDEFIDLGIAADMSDLGDADRPVRSRALVTAGAQIASDGATVAAGAPDGFDAGIIVDVRPGADAEPDGGSRDENEAFDILVDGRHAGTGRVGSRRFIGLSSYRTHRVALVPRGVTLNGFGDQVSDVTLYPGNVERLERQAADGYLLVTRLADASGTPLTNVRLRHGEDRYFVLDDGIVQIEVQAGDVLDIDLGGDDSCEAIAPEPAGDALVVTDAPLICL